MVMYGGLWVLENGKWKRNKQQLKFSIFTKVNMKAGRTIIDNKSAIRGFARQRAVCLFFTELKDLVLGLTARLVGYIEGKNRLSAQLSKLPARLAD